MDARTPSWSAGHDRQASKTSSKRSSRQGVQSACRSSDGAAAISKRHPSTEAPIASRGASSLLATEAYSRRRIAGDKQLRARTRAQPKSTISRKTSQVTTGADKLIRREGKFRLVGRGYLGAITTHNYSTSFLGLCKLLTARKLKDFESGSHKRLKTKRRSPGIPRKMLCVPQKGSPGKRQTYELHTCTPNS